MHLPCRIEANRTLRARVPGCRARDQLEADHDRPSCRACRRPVVHGRAAGTVARNAPLVRPAAFVATGSFLYPRNLIAVGNPIPGARTAPEASPGARPCPDVAMSALADVGGSTCSTKASGGRRSSGASRTTGDGVAPGSLAIAAVVGTVAVLIRGRGLERMPGLHGVRWCLHLHRDPGIRTGHRRVPGRQA